MSRLPHLTRRTFLRDVAAAAAAPLVIRASALGADGLPPSERITLGFIGLGTQGSGHLAGGPWAIAGGFLGRTDCHVLAVCDVDARPREAARGRVDQHYADRISKGEYKACAAYVDFRELLARPDIDAVVISTPDHWHAIITCAAARAGKDIYCEKPMSLTIREAREMVRVVAQFGRICQIGTQQRSDQYFRFACELVRSGRIGKLLSVNVGGEVGGPSDEMRRPAEPVPDGLDWDLWLGPAPWRPFNRAFHPGGFRGCRDFSGGGMTDWGAHHFDIAQWGLGMDGSGPVEIYPPDGKDYPALTYKYANGIPMYHGGSRGILFTGTDGKVEVNRGYFRTWPDDLRRVTLGPDEVHLPVSRSHAENWLECIRTRRQPIAPPEVGCRSVTVCHLGNIARWLGRPLKWDPVKEEFVGDAEANRWLDRPKRAPWVL